MTGAAKNFCADSITHNSNLSTRLIAHLLSESELEFIVGKSTIARTLNKISYRCKKPKLIVKNYNQQKCTYRLVHKKFELNQFLFCFLHWRFTFYLDNLSGSRWVKADEDNLIYSKIKEERLVCEQKFLI